jgi:hypothetical protein
MIGWFIFVLNNYNMNFKELYKFPLEVDEYAPFIVWTEEGERAFDFSTEWLHDDIFEISKESKKAIVELLNGKEGTIEGDLKFSHDGGEVFVEVADGVKQKLLVIRGWGYLTSPNCKNLSNEEACKVQDEFAEFIVFKLNK